MKVTFKYGLKGCSNHPQQSPWAKVNGSYAATIAGVPSESFSILSNAPFVTYIHTKYKQDEMWSILKESQKNKYFVCTNTGGSEEAEKMGLVKGHTYSLIELKEFVLPDDKKLKLIKLRNPWGSFEWKGNYSDKSNSWDILPNLRQDAGWCDQNDGYFFMEFKDFLFYYPYTFMCKYHKDYY